MTCLICLEQKNQFYNLCEICNNCFVCHNCYNSPQIKLHQKCFICREPFTFVNRRTTCSDILYFLSYFRHIFMYIISILFLPNLNSVLYFPNKKHLYNKPFLLQNLETYLLILNFINCVLLPYLFNYFRQTGHLYFWVLCMVNSIFTLSFPMLDENGQAYLHFFYNIVYIYSGCLMSFAIFAYSELYINISDYIKTFNNNMRIIKSKIKVHNNYYRRRPVRVGPIQEYSF